LDAAGAGGGAAWAAGPADSATELASIVIVFLGFGADESPHPAKSNAEHPANASQHKPRIIVRVIKCTGQKKERRFLGEEMQSRYET
jgi:hypothetical protein